MPETGAQFLSIAALAFAAGERFGTFVIGASFVARSGNGRHFHANAGPRRTA